MKKLRCAHWFCRVLLMLLCGFGLPVACQKVELPLDETGASSSGTSGTGSSGGNFSAISPETLRALTVAEVQEVYAYVSTTDRELCAVAGYIVGYIKNTIKNAVFSADNAVETNLLLADSPEETDWEHCLPVQLVNNTGVRAELNLLENPDVLGHKVYIVGYISRYFGEVGMKSPEYYEWLTPDDNESSGDDEEEEPQPGDNDGEQPAPGPAPEPEVKDTVRVDDTPKEIPGGRSLGKKMENI